jgi:two-component system chemotaxis response regulator CheB
MYIVAIAASTGGPRALEQLFSTLPGDLPAAFLVVQHMPPEFTFSFACRLDKLSKLKVKEAEHGDRLTRGTVFVAPGGLHMSLSSAGTILLQGGELVNHVRPAADVLFYSLAEYHEPQRVIAVVLTGMGCDGAKGCARLKKAGALTIAEDPRTALINGMPQAAVRSGAHLVLPLPEIPKALIQIMRKEGSS